MSVFTDQKLFMDVTGQTPSLKTAQLYMRLVTEEYDETLAAFNHWFAGESGETGVVDGCLDLIYVATGLIHALGLDPQPLWDEVQRSNMSKFTKLPDGTYLVKRREDNKILKADGYTPPELERIIHDQRRAGGSLATPAV